MTPGGNGRVRSPILWIEGAVVLFVGLVASFEGVRLAIRPKAPGMIFDSLGPGWYLFMLSAGLMIVGVAHIMLNYGKHFFPEKVGMGRSKKGQLLGMIGALAIYIFIIDLVGYPLASFVFFLIEFRAVGIRSWRVNIVLSLGLAAVYYVVFVRLCDVIFPTGIF